MRLRVFQVAKELDLDAREFFRFAKWAGIAFEKQSMLGRITSGQRDTLVDFLKRTGRLKSETEDSE